jgi:hypothetical protein
VEESEIINDTPSTAEVGIGQREQTPIDSEIFTDNESLPTRKS